MHDVYGFKLADVCSIDSNYEKWAKSYYRSRGLDEMRICWLRKFKGRFAQEGYKELVLVTGSTISPNAAQISKDVTRTAPGFRDLDWLVFRLDRVLTTYSLRNPTLGYTQSMNFIAAVFLAATGSEAVTFWAMADICENILPDYFVGDLLGVRADCALMLL